MELSQKVESANIDDNETPEEVSLIIVFFSFLFNLFDNENAYLTVFVYRVSDHTGGLKLVFLKAGSILLFLSTENIVNWYFSD